MHSGDFHISVISDCGQAWAQKHGYAAGAGLDRSLSHAIELLGSARHSGCDCLSLCLTEIPDAALLSGALERFLRTYKLPLSADIALRVFGSAELLSAACQRDLKEVCAHAAGPGSTTLAIGLAPDAEAHIVAKVTESLRRGQPRKPDASSLAALSASLRWEGLPACSIIVMAHPVTTLRRTWAWGIGQAQLVSSAKTWPELERADLEAWGVGLRPVLLTTPVQPRTLRENTGEYVLGELPQSFDVQTKIQSIK